MGRPKPALYHWVTSCYQPPTMFPRLLLAQIGLAVFLAASQAIAVDEHDALYGTSELKRLGGIGRCGDEHALFRLLACKRAVERLKLRTPYVILPSLCLHVDLFEAETVKRDDPIYSSVAATSDPLEIGAARAVAHAVQQVENDCLEEGWRY